MRVISLKRAGSCAQCGTELPVGTRAKWYRNGAVYGLDCHSKEPVGLTMSRSDPHGIYTPDGRKIGSSCHCEDYPCCGH